MKKTLRIVLIILLFLMLIAIRGYIAAYFYDPLNEYFKREYLYSSIPDIEFGTYFLHLFLRYFLNAFISLLIIYLIFNKREILVFTFKFYVAAFIVLSMLLFVFLKYPIIDGYMLIFYIRRFLIQPLFVFILLPAIYYQQLKVNN